MQKDYRSLQLLGEGAFGQVYLMRHMPSQRLVCVKALKEGKDGPVPWREVQVMQKLCHPCIVRYQGSFSTAGMVYIVMQYADRGDLSSKLKAARRPSPRLHFPESQIWHWVGQLCLAIEYMHARKVIHRDLKPPNIFLLGPEERLVLGDVGVAKSLDTTKAFAHTGIGTPFYMAPEIFANKGHNTKADVWSLGVLLYELAYLRQAFDGESVQEIGNKVLSGRFRPVAPEETHRYSSALGDMLLELLNVNPNWRPSVADLLKSRPVIARRAEEWSRQLLLAAADPAAAEGVDVSAEQQAALQEQMQALWPPAPFASSVVTSASAASSLSSSSSSSFSQSFATSSSSSCFPSSSLSSPSSFFSSSSSSGQPYPSFSSSAAATSQSAAAAQETKLQQVLEKLRKERTARLEASLMTLSISETPLMQEEWEGEEAREEREEKKREAREEEEREDRRDSNLERVSPPSSLLPLGYEPSPSSFPSVDTRRERSVHFSESQERKDSVLLATSSTSSTSSSNGSSRSSTFTPLPLTNTQQQQELQLGMTMTAGGRIRESRQFLSKVLGEAMFQEARRRSSRLEEGGGEGLAALFVGDKSKYFSLFEQLLAMEAAQRGDTSLLLGTMGTRGGAEGGIGGREGEGQQP